MANEEHLKILRQGVDAWNSWREEYPDVIPNLSGADLSEASLSGANLIAVSLAEADLTSANLERATLAGADLTYAYLRGAKLLRAHLAFAKLQAADLAETVLIRAVLDRTILNDLDLSTAIGLETIQHYGPSIISVDTLYRSQGALPEVFLRGIGVPETLIEYLPSLLGQPLQFYSVFISYSHKDRAFAKRLYDGLQGRGIRCWLDEHQLLPGDKIHVEIDRGIRLWDKVLLCCSKHSLTSWWVNNEVELAIQKEQRLYDKERGREVLSLIPLDLDGYMFSPEWQSGWKGQITGRLAPDFTGWQRSHKKFEAQLEQVVKALRADAGARGIPPQPKL